MDRKELLDRLNALLPAQLEKIIFELRVPPELLTGTAQTTRAIDLIRYLEERSRLPELATLLAPQGDRTVAAAKDHQPDPAPTARPLSELVDEVEQLLIERARQVADDVKRGALTVTIDALVAEVKRRGRVKEGDVVAGTKLLKVIGSGNFGTIYLGRRETDGVSLATKVFHLDKITEGMMLWSFRRSIKAMRHLNADKSAPSSIVRIHEAAEDTLAFSMDHLSGGNLEDIASRGWTLQKKMDVFAEVCRSVAFAHAKGVIHRDIKPANVVLSEQQQPVLTDFDISDIKYLTKLSVARGSLGTPVFAAPEQLEDGNNATERSDIYSLGRVLYYLLLERSPGYQIEADPQLANLAEHPATLVAIVRRATQHNPANRYESVAELLRDIQSHQSRAAALRARVREATRWVRRNAALLVIFTLVVSGVGAFGIYQTRVAREKETQRKKQEELANKNAALVATLTKLQAEQDEAQRALNELAKRQGDLNQQRVVLDQQIKLLDDEIKVTTAKDPNRSSLKLRRDKLQAELDALKAKQAEFDRQIVEQQRKLERSKAAARASSAGAAVPVSTVINVPKESWEPIFSGPKEQADMARPPVRLVVEFISEKDGSVIPGVEFKYARNSFLFKNHGVSGQTLLGESGRWVIKIHYDLKQYWIELNPNDNKKERIRISPLGEILVFDIPEDVDPKEITINGDLWDTKKPIRLPSGRVQININNVFYENIHEITVKDNARTNFFFPNKQYGALWITHDAGVDLKSVPSGLERWDRTDLANHRSNESGIGLRGKPGTYALSTSLGTQNVTIRVGQLETMALHSEQMEEGRGIDASQSAIERAMENSRLVELLRWRRSLK